MPDRAEYLAVIDRRCNWDIFKGTFVSGYVTRGLWQTSSRLNMHGHWEARAQAVKTIGDFVRHTSLINGQEDAEYYGGLLAGLRNKLRAELREAKDDQRAAADARENYLMMVKILLP